MGKEVFIDGTPKGFKALVDEAGRLNVPAEYLLLNFLMLRLKGEIEMGMLDPDCCKLLMLYRESNLYKEHVKSLCKVTGGNVEQMLGEI